MMTADNLLPRWIQRNLNSFDKTDRSPSRQLGSASVLAPATTVWCRIVNSSTAHLVSRHESGFHQMDYGFVRRIQVRTICLVDLSNIDLEIFGIVSRSVICPDCVIVYTENCNLFRRLHIDDGEEE